MSEVFLNWPFNFVALCIIFIVSMCKVTKELVYLDKEITRFKDYVIFLTGWELDKEKSAEFLAKLEELKEKKGISKYAYQEIKNRYYSIHPHIHSQTKVSEEIKEKSFTSFVYK